MRVHVSPWTAGAPFHPGTCELEGQSPTLQKGTWEPPHSSPGTPVLGVGAPSRAPPAVLAPPEHSTDKKPSWGPSCLSASALQGHSHPGFQGSWAVQLSNVASHRVLGSGSCAPAVPVAAERGLLHRPLGEAQSSSLQSCRGDACVLQVLTSLSPLAGASTPGLSQCLSSRLANPDPLQPSLPCSV